MLLHVRVKHLLWILYKNGHLLNRGAWSAVRGPGPCSRLPCNCLQLLPAVHLRVSSSESLPCLPPQHLAVAEPHFTSWVSAWRDSQLPLHLPNPFRPSADGTSSRHFPHPPSQRHQSVQSLTAWHLNNIVGSDNTVGSVLTQYGKLYIN